MIFRGLFSTMLVQQVQSVRYAMDFRAPQFYIIAIYCTHTASFPFSVISDHSCAHPMDLYRPKRLKTKSGGSYVTPGFNHGNYSSSTTTQTPQEQKMLVLRHLSTFWTVCELQKRSGLLERVHERNSQSKRQLTLRSLCLCLIVSLDLSMLFPFPT
jgi:hypothetical protein